ncbi:MFS transporter [Cohaesibacter haloalkalitolerans]|uniref:MFS transporter n=1 Tax=Cohaesibacter haloalkalitolerans TaxID=1162980 RepID=UPI000E6539FE|nr:MFS transporter [Cohaesibacter haloalkalitolerans]
MKQITPFILVLAAFGIQLSSGINYITFPLVLQSQGVTNALIGFVMSCDILALIVFSSRISTVVKKFGVINTIIICSITRFAVVYFLSGNDMIIGWIGGMFLYGLTTSALLVVLQTWLNMVSTGKLKGLIMGLYSSALSLGVALAPLLLRLTDMHSHMPFLMSGVISLVVLLVMLTVLKSRPSFHTDKKARIGFVFRHARLIMLSAIVGGFCFFGLPSFLTIYGIKNGLKAEDAALLLTMFMLGSVTLGMLVSTASAFINHYRLVFICVCTSVFCASFLSLAIYSHLLVALGLLYLWGGCMGGIYALGLNIIGEQFRQEDQMSANMTYTLMDAIGGMVGLCIIGTSMDFIGAEGLSYTIVIAAMVYLVYLFTALGSRLNTKEADATI